MSRTISFVSVLAVLCAAPVLTRSVPALAQSATPVAQTTPAAPPSARAVPTQNVKVEVVITDTFGTAPVKKTVTVLLLDGRYGRIRSTQQLPVVATDTGKTSYTAIGINIDATPTIRPDGRVALDLTVGYTPTRTDIVPGGNPSQSPADINESMSVLLLDGKSTLLSQSADPQSDRKVTLEVTATVVR